MLVFILTVMEALCKEIHSTYNADVILNLTVRNTELMAPVVSEFIYVSIINATFLSDFQTDSRALQRFLSSTQLEHGE